MPTPNGDVVGLGSASWPLSATVFPSAARTADPIAATDPGFGVPFGTNAAVVTINTSAAGSSPSTVFNVEAYDPASGAWRVLLASAAVTGTGTVVLRVGVGFTAAANLVANDCIGDKIRVRPVHGNSTSHTYSVGILLTAV